MGNIGYHICKTPINVWIAAVWAIRSLWNLVTSSASQKAHLIFITPFFNLDWDPDIHKWGSYFCNLSQKWFIVPKHCEAITRSADSYAKRDSSTFRVWTASRANLRLWSSLNSPWYCLAALPLVRRASIIIPTTSRALMKSRTEKPNDMPWKWG